MRITKLRVFGTLDNKAEPAEHVYETQIRMQLGPELIAIEEPRRSSVDVIGRKLCPRCLFIGTGGLYGCPTLLAYVGNDQLQPWDSPEENQKAFAIKQCAQGQTR